MNISAIPKVLKGPGFVNLVGNHTFNLDLVQNSNLINDPVKLILRVEGEGFLEELEPPKLYQINGIKNFNVSSRFSLSEDKRIGFKILLTPFWE